MLRIRIIWVGVDGEELGSTQETKLGDINWTVPDGTLIARVRFSEMMEVRLENESPQGP